MNFNEFLKIVRFAKAKCDIVDKLVKNNNFYINI